MQAYPHRYSVEATASAEGAVSVASEGISSLTMAPPAEFGKPEDQWSPETLLVASVADCFILMFRAIAKASTFAWHAR